MTPTPETEPSAFARFASATLDSWLDAHPDAATFLGDHTRDHALPDPSAAGAAARTDELGRQLAELDGVGDRRRR